MKSTKHESIQIFKDLINGKFPKIGSLVKYFPYIDNINLDFLFKR